MYIHYNNNPKGKYVGDCVIRAISNILDKSWDKTYAELSVQGMEMCDMPSSNSVWGAYLASKGYQRHIIPNTCPDCYTVREFCEDHPDGRFVIATGSHVISVINGDYYDSWDSGDEIPIYYWKERLNA